MKQTPKNSRPGAAPLFSLSDRVTVTTAATDQCAATGTISSITAGWYIITLDVPDVFPKAKDGKVSARANSMTLLPAAVVTSKPAPAAIAPSARKSSAKEYDDDDKDQDEDRDDSDEDDLGEESAGCRMSEQLKAARVRYTKTRRPSGAASADNADAIAKALRDYEPLEVCEIADRVFNLPLGSHESKYSSLNPGQKRMNSGNRIRGLWRKLWIADDKLEIARVADLVGVGLSDDFMDDVAVLQDAADLDAIPVGLDAIPVERIGNVGA